MGLLENSLYRQFAQHNNVLLKNIEICHMYELDGISSNIMKQWTIMHCNHNPLEHNPAHVSPRN
ncbi:nuclear pore complex protein Nup85 [Vigna unguiculata]|uniref:Nuclear pore complex protein Nup85 n=1 Tax=Vigna unguiculata TaxID=3917 RepID=A0A4D6KSH9_VIGUN|nr:nuclear pore complex protein Nup85 [Vigna unguiculata]